MEWTDTVGGAFPRAPAAGRGDPGFFAHHGFWAPGVRLFRRLTFRWKALLISLMFLLPLVAVSAGYLRFALAAQSLAAHEQAGVALAKVALRLHDLLQQQRLAAVQGQDSAAGSARELAQAVRDQLQLLTATAAAHGGMVPDEALQLVRANIEKAAAASGSVLAAHKRHSQATQAVEALLAKALDGSGLANEPELDSRYLVEVALRDLPNVAESALARADLALAAGAGAPPAAVAAQMAPQRAIGLYLDERVRDGLDVVIAAGRSPMLAYVDTQDAIGKIGELTAGAGDEGWKPDAAAVVAARALVAQRAGALRAKAIAALDARLEQRVQAMTLERNLIFGLLVVSLFIAAYMFFSFARVMQGGLSEVRRHLRAMTDGDLTTSPNPWGQDEAAHLMFSLRDMQEALCGIVAQVRDSSDGISDASRRIATGSSQLAASTTQSVASLQQSSQAMEEIGVTVRATADGAGEAVDIGRANAEAATRGGEVIGQVISTMREIHGSSSRIGEITSVIDGIAFQTNILALNAAVEAARAGDSGRGFSVVASEVRALAQRSATAAREIKALVGSTVDRIGEGTAVVQRAGVVIDEVVTASQRVNALVQRIAQDTKRQASDVLDVSRSVLDVDRASRTNAALVQETEATAEALMDQARQLTSRVDRFQLPATMH